MEVWAVVIQLLGLLIGVGAIIRRMSISEAKRDQELDDHARRLSSLEQNTVTHREMEQMHEAFQDAMKQLISTVNSRIEATEKHVRSELQRRVS